MRVWQHWWQTLILASQQNPPQFIEFLMLVFAIALLIVWSFLDGLASLQQGWPYLVLSLSFAIGAAVSCLVREAIAPSTQPRLTKATAILLLLISLYSFGDLLHYF